MELLGLITKLAGAVSTRIQAVLADLRNMTAQRMPKTGMTGHQARRSIAAITSLWDAPTVRLLRPLPRLVTYLCQSLPRFRQPGSTAKLVPTSGRMDGLRQRKLGAAITRDSAAPQQTPTIAMLLEDERTGQRRKKPGAAITNKQLAICSQGRVFSTGY